MAIEKGYRHRARWRLWAAIFVTALVFAPAVRADSDNDGGGSKKKNVATFDAELGTAWFNTIYELVRDTAGYNPPVASRAYAYCGVTFYEALVPGIDGGKSLEGQLNDLADLPNPQNGKKYHWPTAGNAAMQTIATHFFPLSEDAINDLADEFYDAYDPDVKQQVTNRSIDFGVAIAEAIIEWSEGDGFADIAAANAAFVPPAVDGAWVGTGTGLLPAWGTIRTFVLESSTTCPAVGHPPFSEDSTSSFYAHALVVNNTTGDAGANLTDDQKDIAFFWADGPVQTGTPPGHWINVIGLLAAQRDLNLAEVAEAYARVGLAVGDAFITCWQTKYETYLQRPITFIQNNIDASWDPLIATPNFPAYTSGHSTQSGAAATVLTAQFGSAPYEDTTHVDRNNTAILDQLVTDVRSFDSIMESAQEAAVSRLYGGIHYLFDNNDGFAQGQCIGQLQVDHLEFSE